VWTRLHLGVIINIPEEVTHIAVELEQARDRGHELLGGESGQALADAAWRAPSPTLGKLAAAGVERR
jgi:hypothetical protein